MGNEWVNPPKRQSRSRLGSINNPTPGSHRKSGCVVFAIAAPLGLATVGAALAKFIGTLVG